MRDIPDKKGGRCRLLEQGTSPGSFRIYSRCKLVGLVGLG